MWSWRVRSLAALGLLTVAGAVVTALIETGPLAAWKPAQAAIAVATAGVGGLTTFVTAAFEGTHERRARRRSDIERLQRGLEWNLFKNDRISPFDVGLAVWMPRRRWLFARHPPKISDKLYRSRSRNRHTSTGIVWRVGMGVIGRCIETGDIVGVDLQDLWAGLRGCDEPTWLAQPEVTVRQRLTFEDFNKAQASGSVIPGGHLNYVLAVPILKEGRRKPLGCVALDLPPDLVPAGVSEGHYIVEGLRGIADLLGSE
ncbi:hypothetical protein KIN34_06300 [Cellulomonas sp. DKR-3]|uniref:GAF domain-containing protein n=1 Tax=Cellulomonas fulva TaxID=2835530 RepID=A0ABS5TXT0_9CELL|nr:hypothetical protein [Cellulomonas fulva]MBT0993897.1 hypothetical protein [Cellulomonas fulva]